MYINFYRNKIEHAISIPVFAYKIKTYVKGKGTDVDVLGDTIINLINKGEKLDIDYITRLIGIPNKYRKLVEYEINELLDNNKICIDSNNIITSKTKEEKIVESFFVLYDKENNVFLDCIIPEKEFQRNYLINDNFNKEKSYYLSTNVKKKDINKYTVCNKIQELITKSNKICYIDKIDGDNEFELFEYNSENDMFLKPFYEINLDIVENIDDPIDADFLIKAYIDQRQDIQIEDPFSGENSSVYIEKHVRNRIDKTKLIKLLNNNNEFIQIESCNKKARGYIENYKKLDDKEERIKYIERISLYKELLLINGDIYKNFSLASIEIEKVVKSLLKDIIDNFNDSRIFLKNVKISGLCSNNELENIRGIKIIDSIINKNHKFIYNDKKVINSIGETSISSYLKCVYMSKYFTKDKFEEKVFKLFISDYRLVNFLNNIWLYRNNTSHNVEKYKYYNSEYDMDIMYKERLAEVTQELMEDLIYFVEKVKSL
ncbi:hypothetical protein LPC27_08135 [Paraclostridium bifermentans]|uniref:hypothetical protein n=1 Tax=Paraclostridium bifermentans TaxID=1490 RepID=UPI001F241D39|nr:hypothetical protein [Paraclostridium bifermentans]MCE9675732.1 hypothetical protein [Paraclostridium bifermentans]